MSPCKFPPGPIHRRTSARCIALILFVLGAHFALSLPTLAQTDQPTTTPAKPADLPESPAPNASATSQAPAGPLAPGSVTGSVVDATGAFVAGAHVRISRDGQPEAQELLSGSEGQFSFSNVAPGAFVLTVTLDGFATQTCSGTLAPGEQFALPLITLAVASASTEVKVSFTHVEMAEAELKDEEKQRVLGVLPNFYVTYDPAALSLTPRQKFELAWKSTIDPVNFGITAGIAGIEQADNQFGGYGQGAQGYAKRFGASYGDFLTSTFIGGAILPSLLKQDPRYFYKGTGSKRSRLLYALANSVICKGDNGHWQANYSAILGSLASGAISNFYYPSADRHDATLTFENMVIGIGATAVSNILQEFVIRKLTPNAPNYATAQP
jgi:Carboxypeptidase regulatory-like domain